MQRTEAEIARVWRSRTCCFAAHPPAASATDNQPNLPALALLAPAPPTRQDVVFPRFDEVRPEHVVPGMRALLAQLHQEIDALEAGVTPTWEGLVEPLERISDRHQRTWGVVSHLKGVQDTEALRKAVEEVQPENVALGLRLSQSRPLYEGFSALRDGPGWGALTPAQRRVVDIELRDFKLGGVGLEGADKERYNAIQQDLAQVIGGVG